MIPINLCCVLYRDINTVIDDTNNIVLTVLNDPKQTRRWNIITSLANSNTQFEILQLNCIMNIVRGLNEIGVSFTAHVFHGNVTK